MQHFHAPDRLRDEFDDDGWLFPPGFPHHFSQNITTQCPVCHGFGKRPRAGAPSCHVCKVWCGVVWWTCGASALTHEGSSALCCSCAGVCLRARGCIDPGRWLCGDEPYGVLGTSRQCSVWVDFHSPRAGWCRGLWLWRFGCGVGNFFSPPPTCSLQLGDGGMGWMAVTTRTRTRTRTQGGAPAPFHSAASVHITVNVREALVGASTLRWHSPILSLDARGIRSRTMLFGAASMRGRHTFPPLWS